MSHSFVGLDWLCVLDCQQSKTVNMSKPTGLLHLIENTWSHWMTQAVCVSVWTCNFKHVCKCSALSHSLLSHSCRPLEFPGLLCDFRGVERSRAGPRVAEWVTAIISTVSLHEDSPLCHCSHTWFSHAEWHRTHSSIPHTSSCKPFVWWTYF